MAAGLGFKDFTTGEVLTAADVDGYLMQGIWVFASAAARDAAVTSPQEGNFAYLKDTNVTTYYTGSAWTNLDTTGMVNPMTTTGDTIYSSSGSTPARLGIGSTGQVLTVAGGVPSWATPSGGFTFTTWTPTWTRLTVGNGTVVARYGQSGKFVFVDISLEFGSTTSITGNSPEFTLPVTPLLTNRPNLYYDMAMALDVGNQVYYISTGEMDSTSREFWGSPAGARSLLSATSPFTFGTGDCLSAHFVYEAA